MEPRWITAFVDQPASVFDRGAAFWAAVTGSEVSSRRGDHDEFATLVPAAGDACVRVQTTADASAGVHVDFHVDAVPDARAEAERLGATVTQDLGHVIMRSPGGLTFCLVGYQGERDVPGPVGEPASALDQICIDVPPARFEAELAFWSRFLGWDEVPVSRHEFFRLAEPDGLPFHLLFQKLDEGSPEETTVVHLDIAAGEDRSVIADRHVALGATRIAVFDRWIVMRDPVGLAYCVTGREPRRA